MRFFRTQFTRKKKEQPKKPLSAAATADKKLYSSNGSLISAKTSLKAGNSHSESDLERALSAAGGGGGGEERVVVVGGIGIEPDFAVSNSIGSPFVQLCSTIVCNIVKVVLIWWLCFLIPFAHLRL